MIMNFKSTIYRIGIRILQDFWRLKGSRRITAFGQHYRVTPETVFPTHRHLRLPKGPYPSQIVRYTDFVQMQAVLRYMVELNDSPTFIDIGSHHGAYAMVLGKVAQRRRGRAIAVEPNPESFKVLQQNVRLNNLEDTVTCEQIAVLDKSGFAGISLQGSQTHVASKEIDYTAEVTILKSLMDKHAIGYVDLLLIDVEGAELPVLRGFPWQTEKPGKIFCELHPYAWKDFDYTCEDLRLFLEEHQYRCFDMYLNEHKIFDKESYIGPCIFIPM